MDRATQRSGVVVVAALAAGLLGGFVGGLLSGGMAGAPAPDLDAGGAPAPTEAPSTNRAPLPAAPAEIARLAARIAALEQAAPPGGETPSAPAQDPARWTELERRLAALEEAGAATPPPGAPDTRSAEALLQAGNEAAEQQRYELAERLYRTAVEHHPRHPKLAHAYERLAFWTDDDPARRLEYERAFVETYRDDERWPFQKFGLASTLQELGRHAEAYQQHVELLAAEEPTEDARWPYYGVNCRAAMARLCTQQGRHAEARRLWQTILDRYGTLTWPQAQGALADARAALGVPPPERGGD